MPQYFIENWYRCLGEESNTLPAEEVQDRYSIRDHLVALHERIQTADGPHRKFDIHPHWRPENLTCHLSPDPYNDNRVQEIFFRYGKSKSQLRSFWSDGLDEEGSIRNHVHIAFGLSEDSFYFQLAFSPWAFQDYNHMRDLLGSGRAKGEMLAANLRELGDSGYEIWRPDGTVTALGEVPDKPTLLAAFPVSPEGWIVIRKNFAPDSPAIAGDAILATSLEELRRLYPVYDGLALRSPV